MSEILEEISVVDRKYLAALKKNSEEELPKALGRIQRLESIIVMQREEYWNRTASSGRVAELEDKLRAAGAREAKREQELENYKALWEDAQDKLEEEYASREVAKYKELWLYHKEKSTRLRSECNDLKFALDNATRGKAAACEAEALARQQFDNYQVQTAALMAKLYELKRALKTLSET